MWSRSCEKRGRDPSSGAENRAAQPTCMWAVGVSTARNDASSADRRELVTTSPPKEHVLSRPLPVVASSPSPVRRLAPCSSCQRAAGLWRTAVADRILDRRRNCCQLRQAQHSGHSTGRRLWLV